MICNIKLHVQYGSLTLQRSSAHRRRAYTGSEQLIHTSLPWYSSSNIVSWIVSIEAVGL